VRQTGPALDSAFRWAIVATTAMGILVAWTSEIPLALRAPTLLLGLLGWTAAVVFGSVRTARAAWNPAMPWSDWGTTILGAAGVGIAALSATQLELIRIVYGRPGLVWNVDWRYAWNHAQAIARFGGVDSALDYAGAPIDYHVGPAWLGAATERMVSGGMTEVLFGLVPLLCVLSSATALLALLHEGGLPRRLAAAVVGVAFCLPVGFNLYRFPRGVVRALLHTDLWFFGAGLMLNSYLAVAVGLCSLALLFDRRQPIVGMLLGAVGLGSLVQIKPQFFIGLGAVAGVLGLGRLLTPQPFQRRSWTAFAAVGGALGVGILAKRLLPGFPVSFSLPVWAPGSTGYWPSRAHIELVIAPTLLVVLGIIVWRSRASGPLMRRLGRLSEFLGAVVVALPLVSVMLTLVSFPVRGHSAGSGQPSLGQALIPLRLLLMVGLLAGLALVFGHARRSWRLIPVGIVAAGLVASPLPLIARNFMKPLLGYEAAEDAGLSTLLQRVPRNGELLIASDLADPAQDYHRALRGTLLTAYGGHVFYVANLWYSHHGRPDAAQRMENLRAFFGSPWSRWHGTWLARTKVTHVFVNDRCVPPWWEQPNVALRVIARSGRWTLLEPNGVTVEAGVVAPSSEPNAPRYGHAACL
jgi:hypothetical protein